jgi:hypothetical protein
MEAVQIDVSAKLFLFVLQLVFSSLQYYIHSDSYNYGLLV